MRWSGEIPEMLRADDVEATAGDGQLVQPHRHDDDVRDRPERGEDPEERGPPMAETGIPNGQTAITTCRTTAIAAAR